MIFGSVTISHFSRATFCASRIAERQTIFRDFNTASHERICTDMSGFNKNRTVCGFNISIGAFRDGRSQAP